MSEKPIPTACYELTPEDWEDVNAAHLFASDLHKEALKNGRIAGALLFATLAVFSLLLDFTLGTFMFGATALVFPALAGPIQRHAQRRALRKVGEEGIANGMFGLHRVELREEGFYHATSHFESTFRWHAVEDVKEVGDHFFIYMGPNAFVPVPITAFPDSESLRGFADAFFEHLNKGREEAARLERGEEASPQPAVGEPDGTDAGVLPEAGERGESRD